MPKTKLTNREISRGRVQRSGYFTDPSGGTIVEAHFDSYMALLTIGEAEKIGKALLRAVERDRKRRSCYRCGGPVHPEAQTNVCDNHN